MIRYYDGMRKIEVIFRGLKSIFERMNISVCHRTISAMLTLNRNTHPKACELLPGRNYVELKSILLNTPFNIISGRTEELFHRLFQRFPRGFVFCHF